MASQICPVEFTLSPAGNSCIVKCPALKNYSISSNGSILSCTYSGDTSIFVQLMPTPTFSIPINNQGDIGPSTSYNDFPDSIKSVYKTEIDRFSNEIAVADGKISKTDKLSVAFRSMQDAENARDTAPDAYQSARVAYYTLLKGDTWVNEEKNRVADAEAQPVINNLLDKYKNLQYTRSRQQAVIDSMNNVKEGVLGVKDDLEFSVSNFQKQIADITNQINKDKRDQTIQLVKATSWIEVLLNWLIGLSTVIAIFFLARYLTRSKPGQAPSDSDIMSYLRRSAYGSKSTTSTTR
jgi:hypothetical protein